MKSLIKNKIRQISKVLANKKHALILIYSNPDPDALASAWALKEIMYHISQITATIAYTGDVGRLENKTMISLLGIPSNVFSQDMFKKTDLIALVDAQPEFFKDMELANCDIIIDHHPVKTKHTNIFVDIRSKCLATSSILTEYLNILKIPINKKLATALYYGIHTDSKNLLKTPSQIDLQAISFLEKKVDRILLKKIEFSLYSLSSLDYFGIALVKLRQANNILYSNMGSVPSIDICVQIADFLIRVKETEWALVSGVVNDKLIIIFRCDGHKKNAGKTAETAFGKIGSAGGHKTMARAEIQHEHLPEKLSLTQNEALEKFILSSLAKVEKKFNPLARFLINNIM